MNTDNIFNKSHVLAYGLGCSMMKFVGLAIDTAMELDKAMMEGKVDISSSVEVCNQENIIF